MGVSSLIAGMGVAHCVSEPNAKAMIAAHLKDTVQDLYSVPLTLSYGLMEMGVPIPQPTMRRIIYPHKGGNSTLSITTAGNILGGRGMTFSFLHLSEAAFYAGKAPFTSLLPAVSNHPSTIVAVESTANGKVGPGQEFYDFYMDAKLGRNEYIAIFLSWTDDPACRRDADEAADGPQNDDERDLIQALSCSSFCGRCSLCHNALTRLAWRRWAIPNLCRGDVEIFHQEYPINDDEAFVSSNRPAFTRDELRIVRARIIEPAPFVGRLEWDISPAAAEPGKSIIFQPDSRSPLHIWKMPVKGNHYYAGADAARGQEDRDYASASIWCGETGDLCARYAARINPEALAHLLNILGRYFNNALMAIELTGNLGLWTQKVMRDEFRYPNFYYWKGRDDKIQVGFTQRTSIGWETTTRTRELIFTAFRSAVRHGRAKPYDKQLLSQMEAAQIIDGRWEIKIGHDDILMAAMIGWIAGEQWHQIGQGISSKAMDLDGEAAPPKPNSVDWKEIERTAIAAAEPDLQGMQRKHWAKVMSYTRRGGPMKNRLEGI